MIQINVDQKIYHNKHDTIKALDHVSFTISTSGLTMILGSSGCGKSTLLNIISGQDHNYQGTVVIPKHTYYLHQTIDLIPSLSPIDNLRLVDNDLDQIDHYLDQFDLTDCKHKKVKRLSMGQQRRVQFIKALLMHPRFLLLDEISASLDYDHADALMQAIRSLASSIPILMVTHDQALANQYADRIITMEDGHIIHDQTIRSNDPSRYTYHKRHRLSKSKAIALLIKARPLYHALLMVLTIVSIISILVLIDRYSFTASTTTRQHSYRYGENIIVSTPNQQYSSKEINTMALQRSGSIPMGVNDQYPYRYVDYDLFDISTIMDLDHHGFYKDESTSVCCRCLL